TDGEMRKVFLPSFQVSREPIDDARASSAPRSLPSQLQPNCRWAKLLRWVRHGDGIGGFGVPVVEVGPHTSQKLSRTTTPATQRDKVAIPKDRSQFGSTRRAGSRSRLRQGLLARSHQAGTRTRANPSDEVGDRGAGSGVGSYASQGSLLPGVMPERAPG